MKYAAFLRAVNVAGNNPISMASLKVLLTNLQFEEPRTLLQSGNVIFSAPKQKLAALEDLLERETEKRLKVRTEYFVRDDKALANVIDHNPFPKEAKNDPGHLVVFFLKHRPDAKTVANLQLQIKGREVVKPGDSHVYITYPDGQGRSKLTNAVIERALNIRGTARNWNTILKMGAALSSD